MMKWMWGSLLSMLLVWPAYGGEKIPSYLVGVWATESAQFKDFMLVAGQALYLDGDGTGAIMMGPPPVGIRITATFNPATNVLEYRSEGSAQDEPPDKVHYNPERTTLEFRMQSQPMQRRFETLPSEVKKSLEVQPVRTLMK